MKIIGKTADGFIIEAEKDEVANLLGTYYFSSEMPHLDIGTKIKVSKMYDQLRALKCHPAEIAGMQAKLRAAADLLNAVNPLVLPLVNAGGVTTEEVSDVGS